MAGPDPGRGRAGAEGTPKFSPPAGGEPSGEARRRGDVPDRSPPLYAHPEAELGGADAVESTTYVVGEGTEPDRQRSERRVARGGSGRGGTLAVWILAGVVALIALAYVVKLLR
jgi:hypothetical protein